MAFTTAGVLAGAAVAGTVLGAKSDRDRNKAQTSQAEDFNERSDAQAREATQFAREVYADSSKIAKESTDKVNKSIEDITKRALAQREKSVEFIKAANKAGRSDLFKLFPAAQKTRATGLQAGLDLYNEVIPMQLRAFQGGNTQAQGLLARGLPQQQNALMGLPVDYSQIQPVGLANPAATAGPVRAPQFQGLNGLGVPIDIVG